MSTAEALSLTDVFAGEAEGGFRQWWRSHLDSLAQGARWYERAKASRGPRRHEARERARYDLRCAAVAVEAIALQFGVFAGGHPAVPRCLQCLFAAAVGYGARIRAEAAEHKGSPELELVLLRVRALDAELTLAAAAFARLYPVAGVE